MNEVVRVLLVEDNPGDADLLIELLPGDGPLRFQVQWVQRMVEAVTHLRNEGVDLVVLDLGLPDSSGMDTLKTMLTEAPGIPVVVLTGNDDKKVGVAAVQAGAQDYLVKGQVSGLLLARVLCHALERHRTQACLKESERFLRATLDGLSAHIAIVDEGGRIIAINAAWLGFAADNGADAEKIGVGLNYLAVCDRVSGDDAPTAAAFAEGIRAVLAGRSNPFALDYPCHNPGRQRWFCGRVTPFPGSGRPCAVVAHEEITSRKMAEEALKESKARLDEAQRIARIGHWEWHVETGALAWSDETFRLFGLQPGSRAPSYELAREFVHPEDREAWIQAVDQAATAGDRFEFDYRARRTDGQTVWIHNEAEIKRDAAGRPLYFSGTAQNITEQKKAQQALADSELRLRTILDAQEHHVLMQDLDMRIVWPNLAACRSSGIDRQALIGRRCHEVWHDRDTACPDCPVLDAIRTGNPHSCIHTRPDGRTWRVTGSPVTDAAGRIVSALETAEDITERRALEGQLRHAQKMESIGVLAGGIAHDFNNILSAIIGYTDLAMLEEGLTPTLEENLAEVARAGQRAKQLVAQILAFSRQMESRMAPVQVHLIVKEAVQLLKATLPATIAVHENIRSFAEVMADPTQVHQVVMNLCTNAFHAMRENGGALKVELVEVEIDAAAIDPAQPVEPGTYLRLGVRDTGSGMDDTILRRIFEPYFTTKGKGEGTGLGLSVVYGIVQTHGGMTTVHSELGKGSAFHVFLPKLATGETANEDVAPAEILPIGSERILLVDDEPSIIKVTQRILSPLGYRMTTYADPREALAHFRRNVGNFDLVITDMTMPGMTGDVLAAERMTAGRRSPGGRIDNMVGRAI